jgi:thiaminase
MMVKGELFETLGKGQEKEAPHPLRRGALNQTNKHKNYLVQYYRYLIQFNKFLAVFFSIDL